MSLLGREEKSMDDDLFVRKMPDFVIINNGDVNNRLVSSNFPTLLTFHEPDPSNVVFNTGRNLFTKVLEENPDDDCLASYPLDVAYAWAIATASAVNGSLKFAKRLFTIRCEDILLGRIFPTTDKNIFDRYHLTETKHFVYG